MNITPLISVIIPCYNAEKFVEQAVRSIMEQTYQNLEIICINDYSKDSTGTILQKLAKEDSRIVYVENEENLKLVKTLNKALLLCKGQYVARMDADDISLSQRIEKQLLFLQENPTIDIVGSSIKTFGDGIKSEVLKNPQSHESNLQVLAVRTCFFHPTVFFHRRLIDNKLFEYDTNFFRIEDYALWVHLAVNGVRLSNIDDVLLEYRIVENSETRLAIKENMANRVQLLSTLQSKILQYLGVTLTEKEQIIYSSSTDKHLFNDYIDIYQLKSIYYKVNSKIPALKKELSLRWIAVLVYFNKINLVRKFLIATTDILTYFGIYYFLRNKL